MLERFSDYELREGGISFSSQDDTDHYEALRSAVSESDKALEEFMDKIQKTTGAARKRLKEATE
jgi:hypothetical protein